MNNSSTATSQLTEADIEAIPWNPAITPHRNPFKLDFGELWRYRDLIYLFVHRDIVSTFKQTLLGPLWFILQPLASTATYSIVFGQIAKLPTNGLPPFLFYMVGIVAWTYFSSCLLKCSTVFTTNAGIFSKVYFPRLAVPISNSISLTFNSAIQFVMFIGFVIFFMLRGNDVHPTWEAFLLPVITLQLAMLGIGLGSIISALTTRYRDLQMAVNFGLQLWMYGSCIFYSSKEVPENLRFLISLNPVVPPIEALRTAFLGAGQIDYPGLAISFAISIVVFLLGIVVFHHVEKDFVDTV